MIVTANTENCLAIMDSFCYGSVLILTILRFSFVDRWSVRHMLTEFLMVAILVYLQLTDHYAGVWSMCAAIISLIGTKNVAKVMLPKHNLC
jgi:hypothetical protein